MRCDKCNKRLTPHDYKNESCTCGKKIEMKK